MADPTVPEGQIAFRYPPRSFIESWFLQKLLAVQSRGRDEPAELVAGEMLGRPDDTPIIPETNWSEAGKLLVWWSDVVKKTRRGDKAIAHPDRIISELLVKMDEFAKENGFASVTDAVTTAAKLDLPINGNATLWVKTRELALAVDSAKQAPNAPGAWDIFVGTVDNMPAEFQGLIDKVAKGGTDATFFVARTLGGAIGTAGGAIIENVSKGGFSGTVKVLLGVAAGFGIYKLVTKD